MWMPADAVKSAVLSHVEGWMHSQITARQCVVMHFDAAAGSRSDMCVYSTTAVVAGVWTGWQRESVTTEFSQAMGLPQNY